MGTLVICVLIFLNLNSIICNTDPTVSDPETETSADVTSVTNSPAESSSDPESAPLKPPGVNNTAKVAKNFTIDWDEVERRFQATLPEEEVGKKWAEMESGLKNGVRSLLRTIFPQIVAMSSDAKVSGNCSAGILKWIISLRHLKGWAVKSKSLKFTVFLETNFNQKHDNFHNL